MSDNPVPSDASDNDVSTSSLLKLGQWLRSQQYRFTTATPATHALVNARRGNEFAKTVADIFGWSRPFQRGLIPLGLFRELASTGLIAPFPNLVEGSDASIFKSAVRCSSLGDRLFLHSAFPTIDADSVFFGPDTYRFASLIEREIRLGERGLGDRGLGERRDGDGRSATWSAGMRIVDIGCGAGPGGIIAAEALQRVNPSLFLADINRRALRFAQANAELAGLVNYQCLQSDLFNELPGNFDLIVANPPYLVDGAARVYRDGGGVMGTGLGVRIVSEGLDRLNPGGTLILYTGVPIVEGRDRFLEEITAIANAKNARLRYEEIDPDVFGEELASPPYASVDRIAIVSAVLTR